MSQELYDKGMAARRAVLGDEYVDNAMKNADALTKPFQALATEYCWGTVWANDDLPHKTRSLIMIGMLVALNRTHELEIHMRAARRNGCTLEDIRAVLMQTAIYVGVPAANDGFRVARKVLAEPM
jgi:4-carboxymuconolactone decarboxylase